MLSVIYSAVDMETSEKNKFEILYNKYKNTLFYKAFEIVKNDNDAEDVLQETFIKIAKNIKCINEVESKETLSFLIVITKNTAFDYMRKQSKIIEVPFCDTDNFPDSDSSIEEIINDLEYRKIVESVKNIPSPYNEVLYLHYVMDYSLKKTASVLNRKISTVKMQLVRGKKILLKKLSEVRYG